ncbi:MAG: N-6 DNA methylase [Balneolaceae bacterium]|nr:N-6 DNA methylase [Balneolaceae bacterium]
MRTFTMWWRKFDYVMANPPFNVSGVDKEAIEGDPRYPLGIPSTDNANYLWIQEFYSALNPENGRAGFVMANSAADARHSEMEIRRKLIEEGVVDVIISIGSNFFYTVTLPCTLWFFDKGKRGTDRENKVLFVDARNIYRQIDRAHRDFTRRADRLPGRRFVRRYRGEAMEDTLPMAAEPECRVQRRRQYDYPAGKHERALSEWRVQRHSRPLQSGYH